MIKAILFDLDNTLYSEKHYFLKSYRYICDKLNLNNDVYRYMIKEYFHDGEKDLFDKVINKFNLSINIKDQMITYYRNADIKLKLFKDTEVIFNNNFKIAIITNGGKATQQNKINILNLNKYFEPIIIAGEYFTKDKWKPSKECFRLCLKKMGLKPENVIYVGDKFEKDVQGAFNASIIPVHLLRKSKINLEKKYKDNKFYYQINSLYQINNIIKELERNE